MKDNDLSASPTKRYWVLAEVVFASDETVTVKKEGWFRKKESRRVTYTPNLAILSLLWQWSSNLGVRMELIFVGDLIADAPRLWDSLEKSAANPFSDWITEAGLNDIVDMLPYRPDLLGVIDVPDRVATYGSRGLTIANLRGR